MVFVTLLVGYFIGRNFSTKIEAFIKDLFSK